MLQINPDLLEELNTAFDDSVKKFKSAPKDSNNSIELFKMSFIKKFTEDIWFLVDLETNNSSYRRTVYLIIRNMLEQLIEFIYLQKNPQYIEEYLGYQVDVTPFFDGNNDIVKMGRALGKKRYINNRPHIIDMITDVGEHSYLIGTLTLYDLYSILSEKCHNSYYMSLIDEYNNTQKAGKTSSGDQKMILEVLINIALQEYSNN